MLKIASFSCDYRKDNRVIGSEAPVFSWVLESDKKNTLQASYKLVISAKGETYLDTEAATDQSTYIEYSGIKLAPNTDYELALTVTDNHGETAEYKTALRSGKLDEKWSGKWISAGIPSHVELTRSPDIFRKFITVDKPVKKAYLYSTALGVYRAYCNGAVASDDLGAPGLTSFHNRVQYQVYDVTDKIKQGENELRAIVAGGWYSGRIYNNLNNFGSRTAFNCELYIDFADGTTQVVVSDKSWKWTDQGPLRFCGYLDGETYDATREDESKWEWFDTVYIPKYENPKKIVYQECTQIVRHQLLTATPVENDKGENIWDFGQNFAGCVKLTFNAPAGTVFYVYHGEELDIGNYLYLKNLTNCKQLITYTCKGEKDETYEPYFTSMGFRYIRIDGLDRSQLKEVKAYARYSDIEHTGAFECSDERLNKFQSAIMWTAQSNFQDVPSDCPQRYERMGWTGDYACFIRTAVMNMDMHSFSRKWLSDLILDQKGDGAVPWVIPNTVFYDCGGESNPCGWADAAIIVPWSVYLAYGDKALLERQYKSMEKLMALECERAAWNSKGYDRYILDVGFHFGDWLIPFTVYSDWMKTAKWMATCFFANSANLLAKISAVLGKEKEQQKYEKLFKNICIAFKKRFIVNGKIETPFQGPISCAIAFGMLDEEDLKTVSEQLYEDIAARDGCPSAGILSSAYIMDAVSGAGKMQEALNMLFNEKMPGWLWMVNQGATTIWETWNGRADYTTPPTKDSIGRIPSRNHYWIGAVGKWIYENIGGLKLCEDTPGYKKFTVSPVMTKRLTHANMSLDTLYGKIDIAWQREGSSLKLKLTVPCNTQAVVALPSGKTVTVGSGKHEFKDTIPADKLYD